MDYRAHFNLAMTLEELGPHGSRARGVRVDPLACGPEDLSASVNLAALEIESGEREAGYARLQALVDRYDTLAMPRVALATHYLRDGRLDEAETLARARPALDDRHRRQLHPRAILLRKADQLEGGSGERDALSARRG